MHSASIVFIWGAQIPVPCKDGEGRAYLFKIVVCLRVSIVYLFLFSAPTAFTSFQFWRFVLSRKVWDARF